MSGREKFQDTAERINLGGPLEVRYWMFRLTCSEVQLRAAVDAVGVLAKDVEEYLARAAGAR